MSTSKAAAVLESSKKEIIERWERRAKDEIEALSDQDDLVVRDHLLYYFDDLIRALEDATPETARQAGDQASTIESSEQHGRLRAAVLGYNIDQLIHEYAILRQVISDFLEEHDLLNTAFLETLNRINERALLTGVSEFSKSVTRTREKIAATLVHDIRNPLTAVNASLNLISNATIDPERHQALARKAMIEVQRIYKMTEEILDAVRVGAGHILELDFREVELLASLHSSFDSIRMTYGERVDIDLPKEEIKGTFAIEGLVRLIENLIVNAVKFGDPDRKITLRLGLDGNAAFVEVHNWGDPIPEERQDTIFLSFSRSGNTQKHSTSGWGIGLTFVRAVVDAHQGRMELLSTTREGTTFRAVLPTDHPSRHKVQAS